MSKDMLDVPLLALSSSDQATFRDFAQNIFVTGVTGCLLYTSSCV